jgi:hypothetical protein
VHFVGTTIINLFLCCIYPTALTSQQPFVSMSSYHSVNTDAICVMLLVLMVECELHLDGFNEAQMLGLSQVFVEEYIKRRFNLKFGLVTMCGMYV